MIFDRERRHGAAQLRSSADDRASAHGGGAGPTLTYTVKRQQDDGDRESS
jgi:hypothetical protein